MANLLRKSGSKWDVWDELFGGIYNTCWGSMFPYYRLNEDADTYELVIEVPGYGKEMLEINIDSKVLSVKTKPDIDKKLRQFNLDFKIDASPKDIKASLQNGLLSIEIPKKKSEQPKSIEIFG